jgi:hypothetical protein
MSILKSRSATALRIFLEMEKDERIDYEFYVGSGATQASGCGKSKPLERPTIGTLDKLMGKTPGKYRYAMEVNAHCSVQFVDVSGKPFKPSVERILAHEMGHGYVYLQGDPGAAISLSQADYDKAVYYENVIAREIDPDAPERAVSDHGDLRDKFRIK